MNMKVHWVYPALHTKNINIACIQGIPWSFFHGEFREFHEFKAYREFPGFFHGIYREFPGDFFHGKFWKFHEFKAQWFSFVSLTN